MAPPPDRRPGFSRRAQYGLFLTYVLAIAGAVIGAALLALARFDPPAFSALRSVVAEATAPVSATLNLPIRAVAGIPDAIGSWFRVHGENAELRAELAHARPLVQRARALGHENRRLRALARVRDADAAPVVTARLVSSTASSTRRFGLLYAGLWQGVREGQPVQGPAGLVGRVVEVGPNTARVLLVIDPESIVPVRRARDGRPGLVTGRGDAIVEVRPVDIATPFAPGDLFVTSGTGGLYPPGIPVARVERRTRDMALARPAELPSTLDFAVVRHAFLPPPPPPRQPQP